MIEIRFLVPFHAIGLKDLEHFYMILFCKALAMNLQTLSLHFLTQTGSEGILRQANQYHCLICKKSTKIFIIKMIVCSINNSNNEINKVALLG
ncbi:hypothetical protein CSW08_09225 [Confluentibacter flavum]|uniref:Uncharacterized protein n=1 Tax=Confluentibacter flavum TaxID=1909700 RepID=A0A2N3HJN4_9FLAO|nr:hypothetical protein CSW08_09225 [Confluentibacter flavum]